MADELKVTLKVVVESDDISVDDILIEDLLIDVAGTDFYHATKQCAVTETSFDAITAGGYLLIANLDDTNFIQIKAELNEAFLVRVNPGEFAFFRTPPLATRMRMFADTAGCLVEYWYWAA